MSFVDDVASWIVRARHLVPRDDRRVLLSPPRLVARFARFAWHRALGDREEPADDVFARDPELVDLVADLFRGLADHYFRLRIAGVENVPASGPFLLVGNHNGGLVPSEAFFTSLAIRDRFGASRAVYALVHDALFDDPLLRRYAGRLGGLRANAESARRAFAIGAGVLVYPGSDMDTFRPFRDRNKVVLAGRTGFIELALRERVPIVPVVTAGAHEQFIVLTRGERLARLVHAHRWARSDVLPLVLAVPWGLTLGFVPYLPLPTQTSIEFLPPIAWPELGPEAAERPEIVASCYREVESAMQGSLDRQSRGRRFLLGPPTEPPIEVSASTEIAASAELVFEILTDLSHYSEWNPFVVSASGDTSVGGTVRVHVHTSTGLPLRFEATVIGRTESRELRWIGHVIAPVVAEGEHIFSIEPLGEGRVRFVQREVLRGAVPRALRAFLVAEIERSFSAMNRALAARAENPGSWMLAQREAGPTVATRFESIGAFLPEHRVTSSELMASTRHATNIDLERLTGIRERRVCSTGEDSLVLAIGAARDCLSRSRYAATDLDMIINASITKHDGSSQHRIEPPFSVSIREALGADHATVFDLSNACAGMLTGVFLLDELIRRGNIRRGMVVSGEHISGLGTNAAKTIRSILSLELASLTLGDAGAAVIVDQAPRNRPGILLAGFTTIAEHSRLCVGVPASHEPGARMFTRARAIHEVALEDGPPLIDELLRHHGLHLRDIDWLIPHQTSVRAIRAGERALRTKLGEGPKHVVVTVDEYGNTASTTLFLALRRCLDEKRFRRGEKIMLLSVASGLEIGVVVLDADGFEEIHGNTH